MAGAIADLPLAEFVSLDGIQIEADEDGQITVARDLTDDQVDLEDAIDVAHDHGLHIVNVVTDMQAAETRLVLGGSR